jgi:hypothetical protein
MTSFETWIFFICRKKIVINKRHTYEACGKEIYPKRVDMIEKWMKKIAHPM